MVNYDVKKGEIYLVELSESKGSVQNGERPVAVVQNNVGNKFSTTIIVCPLTAQRKKKMPTHMSLTPEDCGVDRASTILCEQIITVSKEQIIKKIGEINSDELMNMLNKKLAISLGLN